MLRALLLLLVGLLVGANVVYFVMTHGQRADSAAPAAVPAQAAAADAASSDAPLPVERVPVEVAVPEVAAPGMPVDVEPTGAAAPAAKPDPAAAASEADVDAAADAGPDGLVVPVRGVAVDSLVDTYTDARSEGRRHDAIDIMAPAGTPVIAAADGQVEKLFTSDRGGLTIYQFEPTGRYAYYYAHLQSYAPGLKEKQQVRQGEVIGYVGSTGNASPDAPHLHFAIFVLGPEKQWWKGTEINPYPVLRAGKR